MALGWRSSHSEAWTDPLTCPLMITWQRATHGHARRTDGQTTAKQTEFQNSSPVALSANEHVSGGNEGQSLRLDGFVLQAHKTGRQKTSRRSLHHEPTFANHVHQFNA